MFINRVNGKSPLRQGKLIHTGVKQGLIAGLLLIWASAGHAASADKTLVAWVALDEGDYRAGSILTVQRDQQFDAIVLGEQTPGKWMAGSDDFRRTQEEQDYEKETLGTDALIQMAIVYEDDRISILRNGERLTSYEAENVSLLEHEDTIVVFGLRHVGGSGHIEGTIEDARIYARALSADQIKSLRPNRPSRIEPWAWWDFEDKELQDRTGRCKHALVKGGAELDNGQLHLDRGSVVVAAQSEDALEWATWGEPSLVNMEDYQPETPVMPKQLPANAYTYHLWHPGPGRAEPGDPNPALYYQGRYHLHYIYRNRYGFCFAHLSSEDMVHWKWHPTVLAPPTTGHGMFSGTAFYTLEGDPAIIYHGEGSGRNWVAFGRDIALDNWSEPQPVIPLDADGEEAESNNWDPDCWIRNETYYAISGGRPPEIMKSQGLEKWRYMGNLFHQDTDFAALGVQPNEDVSCANMFQISNRWMLLCISHELGCRYYLGDFKDEKYLPDFHAKMNWKGGHGSLVYFAPESLLTPDGRRVMWTWIIDEKNKITGIQSLPRELELATDGVLRIRPLSELKTLRYDEQVKKNITVNGDTRLNGVASDAVELKIVFASPLPEIVGVNLLGDENDEGALKISAGTKRKTLGVGDINPPFELKDDENLTLRIFVDKDYVEVFANDRQAAVVKRDQVRKHTRISLFSEGGPARVKEVKTWKLKSTYH